MFNEGDEEETEADEIEEEMEASGREEVEIEDSEEDDDDPELANTNSFGLRKRCPLNQLKAFHAVLGFPPDCMHDIMEGVIAQDLYGVIKIFVQKGWCTVEAYNQRLKNLGFYSYDSGDKPQDVPLNLKKLKLPGKAVSLWVHLRNFPLIIKPFVEDTEDEVLKLILLLVEITGRITAVEIRMYEISILEDLIVEYLDKRKDILESYHELLGTAKPKHHFLSHYPQAIRLFGPPLAYWTARFESKGRLQ